MAEMAANVLAGKRIVITRAVEQSEALAKELSVREALPVLIPLVSFAEPEDASPLDAAIAGIAEFDWMILTSAQAVRSVIKRGEQLKRTLMPPGKSLRIACVGPVTAEAARRSGLPVEYVAKEHSGAGLATELGSQLQGAKVFVPRSDRANPDLPVALRKNGAQVTEVIAYRTLRPTAIDERNLEQIGRGEVDAVLFFSPSAVHYFAELFGVELLRGLQDKLAITAVGPVTANALWEAGVRNIVVAGNTTTTAVMESLEKHFGGTTKHPQAGAKRA